MDFNFTEEQVMLRDSVKRFLDKNYDFEARQALLRSGAAWSQPAWSQLAELGLLSLPFPEEVGGLGGSVVDLVHVAESFGEHLTIEPWAFSQVLAGGALVATGDRATKYLADVASGASVAAFAYDEGRGLASPAQIGVAAQAAGDGLVINGEKRLVIGGAEAGVLVVAVRAAGVIGDTTGLALVVVNPKAAGVSIRQFRTQDGRSAAHVRFDNVQVDGADVLSRDAFAIIEKLIADLILVLAAETVGAMGALLRITGAYATTRKQFGVAIGTFQAVGHRLADMKIAYAKAYATLIYTTALVEAGRVTPRDVSVLKAQVGKMGRAMAEAAVQTHGGVGTTDELSVGHYMKRVLAFDAMFGSQDYHYRKVGEAG